MHRKSILTQSQCQDLIKTIPAKQNKLFSYCVIDCSFVGNELVIYEFQPPVNSAIDKTSFLRLFDHISRKIYFPSTSFATDSIHTPSGEVVVRDLKELEVGDSNLSKTRRDITSSPPGVTRLFIHDVAGESRSFDPRHSEKVKQFLFSKTVASENTYSISSDANTGPHETVFYMKHLQRLLLSTKSFNPRFIFIEKKAAYTRDDLCDIADNLGLSAEKYVVIKANIGTRGQNNKFVRLSELLTFLNSADFKNLFAYEDVILIEEVKSQVQSDKFFETHRYAASACPNGQRCLKIYTRRHQEFDSHSASTTHWSDDSQRNDISSQPVADMIKDALVTIQNTDYLQLISILLMSDNNAAILIGTELVERFMTMLFIRYTINESTDHFNFYAIASQALEIPAGIFNRMLQLAQSEHPLIQKKMLRVLDYIYRELTAPKLFAEFCKNETADDLMQKLKAAITASSVSSLASENQVNNNVLSGNSSQTFFGNTNTVPAATSGSAIVEAICSLDSQRRVS